MKQAHDPEFSPLDEDREEAENEVYNSELAIAVKIKKNFGITLSKRPVRGKVINDEDILNLKIALGVAKTIDEFVKMV
jgi:hypothetical protein